MLSLLLSARAEWRAGEAAIRFTCRLLEPPTHERAGYFVQIPDGGILPRPFPSTRVFSSDGAELKSYALWQNRASGLGVAFESPASGSTVDIYVTGTGRLKTWTPESGLTPSAILCADPHRGDLKAAARLARLGATDAQVHYRQNPGHPRAPLCIGGDLSGRPAPCAFYLLAYLAVEDPGRTWIAPMTLLGQSEARIDGTVITPKPRIDKWGGIGEYVDLSRGLHRLEILAACPDPRSFSEGKGVVWMTWAPPNSSIEDLGGPRPANVPYAGTSKQASRVVRGDEIVRSGSAEPQAAVSQDGTPVAVIRLRPTHTYWLEGETPILRYELNALTTGHPADTTYTWSFSGHQQLDGPAAPWLFAGAREHQVTLTATRGTQQTRTTLPFFAYAGGLRTNLGEAADRAAFYETCLSMARATPTGGDPTQGWDNSMWNTLFRTLSLGEGNALLAELFTRHWEAMKRSAPPQHLAALQDRFILIAPTLNPEAARQWVARFEQAATGQRKAELQIKRAELLMYYLDDLDAARTVLGDVAGAQGETRERALIRLGDVEFLAGNVSEATARYADVQNRGNADARAVRTQDWKARAVLEVSASETVRAYLDQAATDEACEVLRGWERRFPLNKLSGDLAVLEAKWYMAIGDHRRAKRLLEAYSKAVDVTSFLAEALGDLLDCMIALKEPPASVKAFCTEARKRLEFHPQAKQFDYRIDSIKDE